MAAIKNVIPTNMKIYEGHRTAPQEALKPIQAGRLKGMSDINPMWRLKALTEEFGPCGIGWYYTVDKQWLEESGNETVGFVNISLFIKVDGEWSKPIFGTGGSKFVTMERNGAYVSDEVYKMATTDAISVACKQLGFAADVYWAKDRTKYDIAKDVEDDNSKQPKASAKTDEQKNAEMASSVDKRFIPTEDNVMSKEQYDFLMSEIERTGQMANIVKWAGTEDLKSLTSKKCCAALTGLVKKPDKTA